MRWLNKNKFFHNHLPLILAVIMLLVGVGSYWVINSAQNTKGAWYSSVNGSWNYRQLISVDPTKVSQTLGVPLVNFPVLISVTNPVLKSVSNGGHVGKSDGSDIVFTAADATTKLMHEIESYNASTGQLIAWVKIPLLSGSVGTTIFMYYGNAADTNNEQNPTAVWDSNFKAIYHLAGVTGSGLYDSTSNGANGTNSGATAATGNIDGGIGTTGYTQYVPLPTSSSVNTAMSSAAWTVSAWFYLNSTSGYHAVFSTSPVVVNTPSIGPGDGGNGNFNLTAAQDTVVAFTSMPSSGAWHYVTATYNHASSDAVALYMDGSLVNSGSFNFSVMSGPSTPWSIGGSDPNYYGSINGSTDEVEVSNAVRSADWIATEYNNQSSPAAFESFGSEQTQPAGYNWYKSANGTWNYRQLVSINPNKVGSGKVYLTSGSTWTVPAGVSTFRVEAIGAGGGGAGGNGSGQGLGGGGGAYTSKIVTYNPGTVINIQIGQGGSGGSSGAWGSAGTDTIFDTSKNAVVAKAGGGGQSYTGSAGAGGSAAASTPLAGAYSGGTGGALVNYGNGGAGGGGAAGPFGSGSNGGGTPVSLAGSGGGGNGGGASTAGTVGGAGGTAQDGTIGGSNGSAGSHGSGGGGGNGNAGGAGGAGVEWDAYHGSGGGGGGGTGTTGSTQGYNGGTGGLYGGGGGGGGQSSPATNGGSGANGIIVITYTPAPLSNFPVLVSTQSVLLKSVANGGHVASSTGADILFTSGDGLTKLPHEIESYSSSTGQLVAWVSVPQVDAVSGASIYMYYGNAADPVSEANPTGVWDSNYKGVWHLSSIISSKYKDSTANGLDGTPTNESSTAGQIANGMVVSYNSTGYVDITGSTSALSTPNFSISAWVDLNNMPTGAYIFQNDPCCGGSGLSLGIDGNNHTLGGSHYNGSNYALINSTHAIAMGQWAYVTYTYDGSTDKVYINGVLDGIINNDTVGVGNPAVYDTYINAYPPYPGAYSGNGLYDEIRYSSSARSPDWIATEYNNQSSPQTFESFGAEQTAPTAQINGGWYNAAWLYRKKIVINHQQVSGINGTTLLNFPVLVSTTQQILETTANGGHMGNANGYDILFTAGDGLTKLNYEREKYVSTTGELEAWVQVPNLSNTTDTVLYLYYGNAGATDQQAATSVWNDGYYKGVYHLGENAGNTINYDSTSNGINATAPANTNTLYTSGQVDGAQNYTANYANTSNTSLDLSNFTVSLWYNYQTANNSYGGPIAYRVSGKNGFQFVNDGTVSPFQPHLVVWNGSSESNWWLGAGGHNITIPFGGLHHLVWTWDGSAAKFYDNGINYPATTVGADSNYYQNDGGLTINRGYAVETSVVDEVEISNTARTPDWINTEYKNQNNPSSFDPVLGEETPSATSFNSTWYSPQWGYRKPIVIDHTKVGATTTPTSVSYSSSGVSTWTVPAGVTSISVKAWGAGGGGGGGGGYSVTPGSGGGGGFAATTLSVAPGDVLTLDVGSQGGGGAAGCIYYPSGAGAAGVGANGPGGAGGNVGASGCSGPGGGGGGGTFVLKGSNIILAAGGGGGGGGTEGGGGPGSGGGGGANGGNGTGACTATGGVAGGNSSSSGVAGSQPPYDSSAGGGGGGGYRGGLGGGYPSCDSYGGAGGGGGSNYGTYTSNGSGTTPGNSSDPSRPSNISGPVGTGGAAYAAGNSGGVVISYNYVSLTNFPVLVNVTDNDLKSFASSTGADILFTDSDGVTKLNYEREAYASSTGNLIAWVQVPNLTNTSDKVLYLYFGNTSASDQQNKNATWDSSYAGVWHLPNGSSLSGADSTSNGNTGTSYSAVPTSGIIDGGASFNGASNISQPASSNGNVTGNITVENWIKPAAFNGTPIHKDSQYSYYIDSNGYVYWADSSNWCYACFGAQNIGLQTGQWQHLVFTKSGSTVTIYLNGVQKYQASFGGSITSSGGVLHFGCYSGSSQNSCSQLYYNGAMDEVRISSLPRGPDWIKTEYNNQSSPQTFSALGGLQTQNHASYQSNEAVTNRSWYNKAWQYRMPITISHNMVGSSTTASLYNFPVLVSTTNNSLKSTANGGGVALSNGYDIAFTDSDGGTKLAHEVESYDPVNGVLVAWVNVPILSTTVDKVIYLYYGNSAAGNQQNAAAVWDSNYKGVYHMPNGSTLSANDSTSNGNNGTITGATATTGKIDGGMLSVSNGSTYVQLPTGSINTALNGSNFTISAWVYYSITPSSEIFGAKGSSYSRNLAIQLWQNGINLTEENVNAFYGTGVVPSTSTWHYIVWTQNGTAFTVYLDGSNVGSGNYTFSNPYAGAYQFSSYSANGWPGTIDEGRISAINRSADWIKTEYLNQSAPATYETFGSAQNQQNQTATSNWYNTSWTNRRTIVIDHSKISTASGTTLTNFPVVFNSADPEFKTVANGGKVGTNQGYDFVFTDSDGKTQLNSEIESYASTTGQLVAWVKIPTLSPAFDHTIYLYYGNSSASAPSSAFTQGVWDSNYQAVWHFAGNANDSTVGGYNATVSGPTSASSQVGQGYKFANTSDRIYTGSNSILNNDIHTISFWLRMDSIVGYWSQIMAFTPSGTDRSPGIWEYTGTNCIHWRYDSGNSGMDCGGSFTVGQWYYITGVKNGGTFTFYINGTQSQQVAVTNPKAAGASSVQFGQTGYSALVGTLDEARISNIVRSADWIATEFANQNSPQTFYALGGSNTQARSTGPVRIYLTMTGIGSWTVPADWNSSNNSIEVIGGGASGGNWNNIAGGGGAYSKITNQSLTAGTAMAYYVGAGGMGGSAPLAGGDSYFCNSLFNCSSISGTAVIVGAKGGVGAGGGGGAASSGVGTTKYSGGGGGAVYYAGGGGGGAGGPYGNGATGGQAAQQGGYGTGGGGGGGNGGGLNGGINDASGNGGNGGNNIAGTGSGTRGVPGAPGVLGGGGGGGTAMSGSGGAGGAGDEWDLTHGSGGGGGGGAYTGGLGGGGGLYGGGGGAGGYIQNGGSGAQGIIVITYTPASPSPIPAVRSRGGVKFH